MQPEDYLRRIPLFSDLSREEIMDVLRLTSLVSFEPGDLLCRQDDEADCMYVIERGEVAVRDRDSAGRQVDLARLGADEIIGDLALVDGNPRSADVVALTGVRCYRIDRAGFDLMRRQLHPAAYKMLRRIAVTTGVRLREITALAARQAVGVRWQEQTLRRRARREQPPPASAPPEPESPSLWSGIVNRLSYSRWR